MDADDRLKWRKPEGLYEKTDKVSPERGCFPECNEYCVSTEGFICLRKKGTKRFLLYSCDDLGLAYWNTYTRQSLYYEWEELNEFQLAFLPESIIEEYHLRELLDRTPVFIERAEWYHLLYDDADQQTKDLLDQITDGAYYEYLRFMKNGYKKWDQRYHENPFNDSEYPHPRTDTFEERIETCKRMGLRGKRCQPLRDKDGRYEFFDRRSVPQLPYCTWLALLYCYCECMYPYVAWPMRHPEYKRSKEELHGEKAGYSTYHECYLVYTEGEKRGRKRFNKYADTCMEILGRVKTVFPDFDVHMTILEYISTEKTRSGAIHYYKDMNGNFWEWEHTCDSYVREDGGYMLDPKKSSKYIEKK